MRERILVLCLGVLLDLLLGDPHGLWHPVRGIGWLISHTERVLYKVFRIREERELHRKRKRLAGALLAVWIPVLSVGIAAALRKLLFQLSYPAGYVFETVLCYQMLAMRSLRDESMKVLRALEQDGLSQARQAVSMIVGRDTENLSREGVIKATVETVAENTSDGVVAPLLFMLAFGPLGGLFYKSVNTMDSMVGYRNDRYCYFGTAAARLDDVLNWIPSRTSALFMIAAAWLLQMDARGAWRIFRRDRYRHKSPNSAQTEAACAGALGIQLAGDAVYFGKTVHKPLIGDPLRPVEVQDIERANRLMMVSSLLVLAAGIAALCLPELVAAFW